jgi:AcrR family transcriptional regulator
MEIPVRSRRRATVRYRLSSDLVSVLASLPLASQEEVATLSELARQPTSRPRDRRDQIARNAGELFSKRGFHSVRMDDIAQASGITARALYRHFANKQAILSHVVIEDQQRLVEIIENLDAPSGDAAGRDAVLALLTTAALESPRLSLLWQREARHLDVEEFRRVRNGTRWIAKQFADLVIRPGRTDLDDFAIELRAWAIVSIVSGPGLYDVALPPHRLGQELLSAGRRVVAAPPPPKPVDVAPPNIDRAAGSRREQLISTSAKAFRHSGFGGVSIDDIGHELGITGPGLYRYFDNKVDILVAAINRFYEWQSIQLTRSIRTPVADTAVISNLVQGYIRVATEATDLLAVSLTEKLYLPSALSERFDRIRADFVGEWQRWLSVASPELSDVQASVLVNVAKTMIEDCVRIPHLQKNPLFADYMLAVVLAALGLPLSGQA